MFIKKILMTSSRSHKTTATSSQDRPPQADQHEDIFGRSAVGTHYGMDLPVLRSNERVWVACEKSGRLHHLSSERS